VPRRYVTDAIVLSRFDLGEADRVLTLITPQHGKLKAIAKGIRRPTSRLGGSLEPFAELRVALARGRTFDVVTEVHVGHAWLALRDRLESAATAWYLAELADRSLEERHEAEPLYALLHRAYELLDAGMAPERVARWYEMHLADELGQRPEVDRCVECDRMLEATEAYRWVPPLGGVLCGRCPGPPAERAGLSLDALKLLKAYQRLDIEAIAALRLRRAVEREVESAMRGSCASPGRDPRSLAFWTRFAHIQAPARRRLKEDALVFDTGSASDEHALERLRTDRIGWLTTVTPAASLDVPDLVPVG
jgi:DNA repair protein RecO (recombination protein O)